MRLALQGEPLPLWVSAERQTGGRGRQGRTWTSLPGNLHASVAFSSSAPPHAAGQIALAAGLMFYDAVAQTTDLARAGRLRLKWPNDLLIGEAKTGGILVECTLQQPGGDASLIAVIGFGLNIVNVPDLDRPVTSLAASGAVVDSEIILAALAEGCETWLDTWDEGRGFEEIRAAWQTRGGPLGEPISVNTQRGRVSGRYGGLSAAGALLLDVEGRLEEFNFGDVALGT